MAKNNKSVSAPACNRKPNNNRKLLPEYEYEMRKAHFGKISGEAIYSGNPVHKVKPGNFGLHPACYPDSGHMKCDMDGHVESLEVSIDLLKKGLEKGFVDVREKDGWPAHVWAVRNNIVFEAKYSRHKIYHGYPAQQNDPLAKMIRRLWRMRNAG